MSEQIQQDRKDAESAGWVRMTKHPESWGWMGYEVMRYSPSQWWAYLHDHRGYGGLGINEPTKEAAQAYCEKHYRGEES